MVNGKKVSRRSAVNGNAWDREKLLKLADDYLDALVNKDPSRLPWAEYVSFTENNVALYVGDGAWNTVDTLDDYYFPFADEHSQTVGLFRVIRERGNPAVLCARIKVEKGGIAELETIVARRMGDAPFPNPDPLALATEPVLEEVVPEAQRRQRERLIAIADGYFSTLQLNDGTLFVEFDERCNRRENGNQTTNNPALAHIGKELAMKCEDAFRLGVFRFDDRLRDRRYHLVDEERGLVFASAFIDHAGLVKRYTLTDGTEREAMFKTPHSFCMLELFKIQDGKLRQIEAVFVDVPYRSPSPWSRY
jgi:hypothetical protein